MAGICKSHKQSQLSVGGHRSITQAVKVISQADVTFIHMGMHIDQASGHTPQWEGAYLSHKSIFTHGLCVSKRAYGRKSSIGEPNKCYRCQAGGRESKCPVRIS